MTAMQMRKAGKIMDSRLNQVHPEQLSMMMKMKRVEEADPMSLRCKDDGVVAAADRKNGLHRQRPRGAHPSRRSSSRADIFVRREMKSETMVVMMTMMLKRGWLTHPSHWHLKSGHWHRHLYNQSCCHCCCCFCCCCIYYGCCSCRGC